MSKYSGYVLYEAGQAVAAAHLGLTIRRVSANPADAPTEIFFPRGEFKPRLILWLSAIAAESRGIGASDPLRRTRNRLRIRAHMEALLASLEGTPAKRNAAAKKLRAQAQDRANDICTRLFAAIEIVAKALGRKGSLTGKEVVELVAAFKTAHRAGRSPK